MLTPSLSKFRDIDDRQIGVICINGDVCVIVAKVILVSDKYRSEQRGNRSEAFSS